MGSRDRLVSLLFALLLARVAEAGPPAAGSRYLTTDERWMKQRLDHFSPTVSQLHHPIDLRNIPGIARARNVYLLGEE